MLVMDEGKVILDGKPFDILCREEGKLKKLGIHPPQLIEISRLLGFNCRTSSPPYENILKRLAELLMPSTGELQPESRKEAKPKIPPALCPEESLSHVRIEKLCFRREDGSETLKNVNLDIKYGEFLALLGHNGAGKTTLAGHLMRFHKPSSGRILLNGKNISKYSTAQLSQQIGYLFQNPDSQIFMNSVFEEVRFGLKNLKIPEEEMKKLFSEPYSCRLEQRAMTIHGWRWLEWNDTAQLDDSNNVKSILGVGRDITDKKESELELIASEEKFPKTLKILRSKSNETPIVIRRASAKILR